MKCYAEFYAPGTFVAETESLQIKDPNNYGDIISKGKKLTFRYNAKAYCFRCYTKDDQGNKLYLGKRVFFGVKIRTLQDVIKDNLDSEKILRSNMEGAGFDRIAEPIEGWKCSIPLRDDDIVI